MEHFTPTPKTRTAAQIEAARANGAKSRGPVTPEGKAVCARNALRHGHLAKMAVVPRESEDAFLELSHDIHAAFQPRDEHERSLVDTMVLSSWRRSRCVAMESAALAQQMADHESALEVPTDQLVDPGHALYLATSTLASGDNAFTLLERYETRHTRAYERAARSLMLYRKYIPPRQQAFAAIPTLSKHRYVWNNLLHQSLEHGIRRILVKLNADLRPQIIRQIIQLPSCRHRHQQRLRLLVDRQFRNLYRIRNHVD